MTENEFTPNFTAWPACGHPSHGTHPRAWVMRRGLTKRGWIWAWQSDCPNTHHRNAQPVMQPPNPDDTGHYHLETVE